MAEEKDTPKEEDNVKIPRKEYESLLEQLTEERKLASIGKYVGGIMHNFNGKLNLIIMNSALIIDFGLKYEEAKKDEFISERVEKINKACGAMEEAAKGIVDKANNLYKTKTDHVNLNDIVNSEVTFFEADAEYKHNTTKEINLQQELPQMYGAPSDLSQILSNLISNGVEAMYGKSAEDSILTIATKYDSKKNNIELTVKDTGCGIDKKSLEKIFEPNFTTKTDIEKHGRIGNGIGMGYVKRAVEDNKGYIEIDSKKSKYTIVKITFPAIKDTEETKD